MRLAQLVLLISLVQVLVQPTTPFPAADLPALQGEEAKFTTRQTLWSAFSQKNGQAQK